MVKSRKSQKIEAFKEILLEISKLSVSQTTKVGCIAFKKNFSRISSFGYNGTYPGAPVNECTGGEEVSLEPGLSGFLHAEDNMVAKFHEKDPEDHIVFVTLSPCRDCTIRLVNAGFKEVYWIETYRMTDHLEIFEKCDVKYGTIDDFIEKSEA
jgi:deoxycytidylate deaminase